MVTPSPWLARPVKSKGDPGFESIVDSDFIEEEKTLKDCNICLFRECILSCITCREIPLYYGIVCLTDGRVVIVDYNNKLCCLYDSSYHYMSDCMMSSEPWAICTVDTDEVAVALPDEKKIQFMKIGDIIQPSEQIITRRMCLSVVALNKTELVYAGTKHGNKTYYWGVITRDGQERSCFYIQRGNVEYSNVHVALNSSKTRAYISCHGVGTVYCVDLDGMVYFEYKVQEGAKIGNPQGIGLDREDNVYVVVRNLKSIHRLSLDCQLQTIFKDSIPQFPRSICFKQPSDNFLLSTDRDETANICSLYTLK